MSFNEILETIKDFFLTAGWNVFELLATLIIGVLIIKIIIRIMKVILFKSPIDNSVTSFILSISRFVCWVILAFIIADILSIPLTSFIAIVSAIGLAVGLALQNSLSNLANGVVIIGTKPFKEGDLVDVAGTSGKIKAIRMLTVELITPDNKKIIIPNSQITNGTIVNYSARPTRRVDLTYSVSYDSDIDAVKKAILKVIKSNKQILKSPEPLIRLNKHNNSSLDFACKVWTNTDDYWNVYFDMQEQVVIEFRKQNIEIPYNKLDVQIKESSESKK